jgi:hypothetical protein
LSVRYCGRDFSVEELTKVRRLIAEYPTSHRAQLSRMTCLKEGMGTAYCSNRAAMHNPRQADATEVVLKFTGFSRGGPR